MDLSSFFLLGPEPGERMANSYNIWLIILSYLVSSFAAYTAVEIATIIKSGRDESGKIHMGWLFGGSIAMGGGVFTMHFVAMLAFTLPIPVFYDVWITLLSIVPAILMAGVVLSVLSGEKMGVGKLVLTALIMAVGIGSMHYTGMYAMRGDMLMLYSPWLFAISIIVAKLLSLLALTMMSHFIHQRTDNVLQYKIGSALVMGAAICAMHYTGMAATYYYPRDMHFGPTIGMNPGLLAGVIALVSMFIISINLILSTMSQRKFTKLEGQIIERKIAEKQLRFNELRFRTIFNTADVSIWVEDLSVLKNRLDELKAEGHKDIRKYIADNPKFLQKMGEMIQVVDINDATVKMYDAENKEHLLGSLDKILLPETAQILEEEIAAIAEGKSIISGETVNQTLTGRKINILLSMAIPYDKNDFDFVIITILDITEQKKAEKALIESEEKYRKTVEKIPVSIINLDDKGLILSANPIFEKMMGLSIQDILNKSINEVMPLFEKVGIGDHFLNLVEKKTPFDIESPKLVNYAGETKYLRCRGIPIPRINAPYSSLILLGDITERLNAEEDLIRSETKHRTVYESSTDAIMLLINGKFVDCNQATVNMFGCKSKSDIIDKSPSEFSPEFQPDGNNSMVLAEKK